jgi:hypothetical protein
MKTRKTFSIHPFVKSHDEEQYDEKTKSFLIISLKKP